MNAGLLGPCRDGEAPGCATLWRAAVDGTMAMEAASTQMGTRNESNGTDRTTETRRKVLLVGGGLVGQLLAEELARDERYQVCGVLDDDQDKQGRAVGPFPVLAPVDALHRVVQETAADEVIIAIASLRGERLREIALACLTARVPFRVMPSIAELLGRPVSSLQARPAVVGDLLRRSVVGCDELPPAYLRGARVLITGAGGSIGRELCHQVARAGPEALLLLGRGENSIHNVHADLRMDHPALTVLPAIVNLRNESALRRVFATFHPTVVLHAAAHKHVPLMQSFPSEAVRNNVVGTRHVMEAAVDNGVERFVLISSDKAVAPTSVMGATKRICEWLVSEAAPTAATTFLTVRFGNVLGSRGSVVPVLERQIARGGPLQLTHPETTRFFMTVEEASFLVLRAGGVGKRGDLLVLDMGHPVRILDLAHDLARLSGVETASLPICYIGLRPGEKLHEALWEDAARVERRADGLIRVQEAAMPDVNRAWLKALEASAERDADEQVMAALRSVFPALHGVSPRVVELREARASSGTRARLPRRVITPKTY